jgi:hypothetical protein
MKKSSTDSVRIQSAKNSQIVIDKRKHKQRYFLLIFLFSYLHIENLIFISSFNESPNKFNSESLGNWRPITAHTTMSSGFFNGKSSFFSAHIPNFL